MGELDTFEDGIHGEKVTPDRKNDHGEGEAEEFDYYIAGKGG